MPEPMGERLTALGFGTKVIEPVAEAGLSVIVVGGGGEDTFGTHTRLAAPTQTHGPSRLAHLSAWDVAVGRIVAGIVTLHCT